MTASPTPFLYIRGATKNFDGTTVLDGVDLAVRRGEFVSLLGPSGCGKTTLLRMVAGLLQGANGGKIMLDGEDIGAKPPHHRDVGVVFQNYALFPHLTVADNIGFGLAARREPKDEIAATVSRFLDLIHMKDYAKRSVRMLSGGQQQRVAVARALAVRPKLLLLDEPFSALDRKLRETMQIELKRLLRELGTTAVFVTHDQDEALIMSDRIAVMNKGRIEQLGTPGELYSQPATAFALGFVGLSSRFKGRVIDSPSDGVVQVQTAFGMVNGKGRFRAGSPVIIGVRPERIHLGEAGENVIFAPLRDLVFQGARVQAHFASPDDLPIMVECATDKPLTVTPGANVPISWAVGDTHVFPDESLAS